MSVESQCVMNPPRCSATMSQPQPGPYHSNPSQPRHETAIGARTNSAFTLIELLIVVAIIAFLAAIAVPNFLEAQTRAKVSRAKADLRTVATALETYCVDNNGYPLNGGAFHIVPIVLTSPVAYLTTHFLVDPFSDKELDETYRELARYYTYTYI